MARIMVIDDDANVCSVIAAILTRRGYDVEVFVSAREGLRSFVENPPDLVMTDVYMPEMDGIELLLELETIAPQTPVIVMSGGGIASIESTLTDASFFGAVSTISKPIDVDALVAVIESALDDGPNGGNGGLELVV